jgi:outer membrane scaffolding protein for murein synthesis (MipA/OmpV family)
MSNHVRNLKSVVLMLGVSVFAASDAALAQSDDWNIVVGVGLGTTPKYQGSKSTRVVSVPLIDITYKNKYFLNSSRGLGANFIQIPNFDFGLSVRYNVIKRNVKDNANFAGLGDLKGSVEAVAFMKYKSGQFTFDAEISQGLNKRGHNGIHIDLMPAYTFVSGQNILYKIGPVLTYGNAKYLQNIYGVNDVQAVASIYNRHTLMSGFESFAVQSSLFYWIDRHWKFNLSAKYSRFIGDVKNSPLLEKNSQISAVIGILYRF